MSVEWVPTRPVVPFALEVETMAAARDGRPDATRVSDCDADTLGFHPCQHGVGHQITHFAFFNAAVVAVAING